MSRKYCHFVLHVYLKTTQVYNFNYFSNKKTSLALSILKNAINLVVEMKNIAELGRRAGIQGTMNNRFYILTLRVPNIGDLGSLPAAIRHG